MAFLATAVKKQEAKPLPLKRIACPYCAHQKIEMTAFELRGETVRDPMMHSMRFGCDNGHKFAV